MATLKLILPTLGDFANGVFAISISAWLFGVELSGWYFLVAVAIALLPDLDALPEVWQHGQVGKRVEGSTLPTNHRTYLHYPAIFLVIGLFIFKISQFWGTTFLIGVGLHFLRDALGTGWGVKLFWPVSEKNIKFFAHGNHTLQVTHVMTDEEIHEFADQHGNENWIDETYLRFSWIGLVEYGLFSIALLILGWHLLY